jgi:superfamily II DNA or RNA helicase
MMENRYKGYCAKCSAKVEAKAGRTASVAGIWRVWHPECVPAAIQQAAQAAAPVVRVVPAPEGVEVKIEGKLGDLFGRYKAAQDGAGLRWLRDSGRVVGSAAAGAAFVAAVAGMGDLLVVDASAVASTLAEAVAQQAAEADAARARSAVVDAALAAKGGALYPYQRTGVEWLAPRSAALLADDMGLGKTLQALLAAPEGAPLLVVCPAVAKPVWAREAARWRPDLRPVALSGRGSFRWPVAGEMVVVNYDILPATLDTAAPAGLVVVADEAHALKNAKAQRTERFRAIAESARAAGGRSWLLTATPILNRPPELFSLLKAAGAEGAIGGWRGLVQAFGGVQDSWGGWSWSSSPSADAIRRLQSVMLRRNKAEVLADLPAKRVEVLEVEIDRASARACDLTVKAAAKRGGIEKVLDAVFAAAGGAGFEELAAARAALAVAKASAVQPLLDAIEAEEAGPVVVFSAHRAAVDVLGAREGWATITGDTPAERRGQIEEAFQRGEIRGIAGTIKAMGVAITLTRATRAIFLDEEWTPALNQQAQDRIYRIGQKQGTLITRIVANHAVDARIVALLGAKQQLIDGSITRAERLGADAVSSVVDAEALVAAASTVVPVYSRDAELAALAAELEALDAKREADAAKRRADKREDEESRGDADKRATFLRARATKRREELVEGPKRAAKTEREEWAVEALASVAEMDTDHAKYKNDMGFSKADSLAGHSLARLAAAGLLDDAGWAEAGALACRYAGQVGGRPA